MISGNNLKKLEEMEQTIESVTVTYKNNDVKEFDVYGWFLHGEYVEPIAKEVVIKYKDNDTKGNQTKGSNKGAGN